MADTATRVVCWGTVVVTLLYALIVGYRYARSEMKEVIVETIRNDCPCLLREPEYE